MTIDASALVGLAGILIGLVAMSIAGLLKLANGGLDRRLAELEKRADRQDLRLDTLAERVRLDELETMRIRGDVVALTQRVTALERDQVPRAEWEQQIASIHKQLADIAERLDRAAVRTTPPVPSVGRRRKAA